MDKLTLSKHGFRSYDVLLNGRRIGRVSYMQYTKGWSVTSVFNALLTGVFDSKTEAAEWLVQNGK